MLNSYIPYLPGLVDSPKGVNMKKAMALDDPELAQLLLQLQLGLQFFRLS